MTYIRGPFVIHTLDPDVVSPRTLRRWFARIPANPPPRPAWSALFGVPDEYDLQAA